MRNSSAKKLVSAIVPAFKTEPYLDTFLDSIRNQSILDQLEVVLDLNKPSPFELKVVERHKKILGKHLKVIINDEVNSISASMNNAILHSEGTFVAIWNVDDLRTDDSLEFQRNILVSDQDVVCAIGPYKKVKKFTETMGPIVDEIDLSPKAVLNGMHLGPFYMFRKSITNRIGFFDEQLRSGGDFDFAIRLARAGKIASAKGLLGWYLDAGLGASTRPNSLQPIERTVIELRYGIFHKIDTDLVPATYKYSIPNLCFAGKFLPVMDYFENYSEYMEASLEKFQFQKTIGFTWCFHNTLGKLLRFLKHVLKK